MQSPTPGSLAQEAAGAVAATTPRREPRPAGRQQPGARPERSQGRLVVVSDRLPITLTRDPRAGEWRATPSTGALISALTPLLRDRRGVWIGWPGLPEEDMPGLRQAMAGAIQEGYSLRPVALSEEEWRGCFGGFSRDVLWPLFHDLAGECRFELAYWQAFRKVNRKFARAVAKTLGTGGTGGGADFLWVHDYRLMKVAKELRRLGVSSPAAFFLHIPFPAPDNFLKLPWRARLLAGLLAFDRIGFQTARDLGNFLACVRALVPRLRVGQEDGEQWSLEGEALGQVFRTRGCALPIGIDFADVAARAALPAVEARSAALCEALQGQLVLGIDSLDRSQGVLEKLRAFARLLQRKPALREHVSLLEVVAPSREKLARHAVLRAEIERLVGEINGHFSRPGWIPVHYLHRSLAGDDVLAYYRAADVALITPLREGMNLMAKEYCAANLDEGGAVVLSEFAGAAPQLACGALLVNPCDTEATARALFKALRMRREERGLRMRRLREEVRRHDIFWWASSFLGLAAA
jgi:trehalose 6-phosphate synthase/phosphatase